MTDCDIKSFPKARRANARQAFTLLELMATVTIVGILAGTAFVTFGFPTLATGGAAGFARKISLSLVYARRATIATGENHYLQMTPATGNATSFVLMRRTGGGDVAVDSVHTVPTDVTVTSTSGQLEFDFEGSALAAYTVSVAGPNRSWNVSVVMLTGAVQVIETTP